MKCCRYPLSEIKNKIQASEDEELKNWLTKIVTEVRAIDFQIYMKISKFYLIFWNNANELVQRLRLLHASLIARKTGVRNEIINIGKELVYMISYSRETKGYKYILCVIDCFIKFEWGDTLNLNNSQDANAAAETIFSHRRPRLCTIGGQSFIINIPKCCEKHTMSKCVPCTTQ